MTDLAHALHTCLVLPLAAAAEPAAATTGLHKFFEIALQPMALFGWIGQALFFSRFLVQWIVSEKERRSTIPLAFWYLSISGGSLFLIYALWRHDLVLTVGQSVGLIVYTRNLMLIHRTRRAELSRPANA